MKPTYSIPFVLFSLFALVDCRAASRDCRDRFHNCDTWKRSGFCTADSHTFYLKSGCAKSCGFCTSSAVPSIVNLHAVHDIHARPGHKNGKPLNIKVSVASATKNFAEKGALQHKLRVPPAGGEAAKPGGEKKPECNDRFVTQTCKEWKDGEICMDDRYRKYLTYGCAMTCRFCNCRDTYREDPYCEEWKSRGFCETYKNQLDTYCPKTCGFCISDEYEEENTTAPAQNATANATTAPPPAQNATATPTAAPNATATPTPAPNATATPTPAQTATATPTPALNATGQNGSTPDVPKPKPKPKDLPTKIIRGHPIAIQFADNGNTNAKRGLQFRAANSPLWSVNADTRLTLPQPENYDDMGGAVSRPLEDGTYFTPSKTNEKFDYYTEHYSPDPYVAAAQREEWMSANHGITGGPSPSLSRKSKKAEPKPETKPGGKESDKALKKTSIRHKHGKH